MRSDRSCVLYPLRVQYESLFAYEFVTCDVQKKESPLTPSSVLRWYRRSEATAQLRPRRLVGIDRPSVGASQGAARDLLDSSV